MATILWTGTEGDWNDPSNWAGGLVPTTEDIVAFSSGSTATLFGSAYVGTLCLNGADVTLAGNFDSDGSNPAVILDGSADSTESATLTVQTYASVAVNSISLSYTSLEVLGLFNDSGGTLNSVLVEGVFGNWLTNGTEITGAVSIVGGGTVAGNVTLETGATIVCDTTSTIESGTLSVNGLAALSFINPATGPQPDFVSVTDAIMLVQGATLDLTGQPGIAVELNGVISGEGLLCFSNEQVVLGPGSSLGSNVSLTNSQVVANGADILNYTSFTLNGSQLNLRGEVAGQQAIVNVDCVAGINTVFAGSESITVNPTGASKLTFVGGSGNATITASAAVLSVLGGTGSENIYCGTSGVDTVSVGAGSSHVYGTSGSSIIISGSGNNTITAGAGSETINGAFGTGINLYNGGLGSGTTAIITGLGDATVDGQSGAIYVVAGAGNDIIWGGSSGKDTIIGGTGSDTLFGGTGALVTAEGSSAALLSTYNEVTGACLDASNSSGNDSLFGGGGSGTITMTGGSGVNLIVGGASTALINCGSGQTLVFAGSGPNDTIIGGFGLNVIVGGPASKISIVGTGADGVVSEGQGTVLDATKSSGSDTIFAVGSGVTSIYGGSGREVIVGATSRMFIAGGSGNFQAWGSSGGYDTIFGGQGNDTLLAGNYSDIISSGSGNDTLIAEGTGVILDSSRSSGNNICFLSADGNTTVQLGAGHNAVVGSGGSATININAGQDGIWGESTSLAINLIASESSGVLNIYQFDSENSSLSLPTSDYEETQYGNSTFIFYANETIVLNGIINLPTSDIVTRT